MRKLNKTFTFKCNQEFLDILDDEANKISMSKGWLLRTLVENLHEGV